MTAHTEYDGVHFHCGECEEEGDEHELVAPLSVEPGRCGKVWVRGVTSQRQGGGYSLALWCKAHGQIGRSHGCNVAGLSYARRAHLDGWELHRAHLRRRAEDVSRVVDEIRRCELDSILCGPVLGGEPWALRRAAATTSAASVAAIQSRNRMSLRGMSGMIQRAALGALGHARSELAHQLLNLGCA